MKVKYIIRGVVLLFIATCFYIFSIIYIASLAASTTPDESIVFAVVGVECLSYFLYLLAIVLIIAGIVIQKEAKRICPACGIKIYERVLECPDCGKSLGEEDNVCPHCGAEFEEEEEEEEEGGKDDADNDDEIMKEGGEEEEESEDWDGDYFEVDFEEAEIEMEDD